MSKKIKWVITIIIAAVIVTVVVLAATPNTTKANPYTKVGLRKDFSSVLISAIQPSPSDDSLGIIGASGNVMANVLVYPYYAYLDYKAGNISESQFFQVMQNTSGSATFVINEYNTNLVEFNKIGFNGKDAKGESVALKLSDGSWHTLTLNYFNLQGTMMTLAQQIYQSKNPDDIYQDIRQYGAYLEQGTFYFAYNTQYGMDQINANTFQEKWLFDNTYMTMNSVQALFK